MRILPPIAARKKREGNDLKVVIDTNVVFAGLVNSKCAAFKIFQRFFNRQFDWITSQEILDEYRGVLLLSQKILPTSVYILLHLLRKRSIFVKITGNIQVCRDFDDDKFLETAIIGCADFLVTKNLKHFPRKSYQDVRIVNVATFLKEIEKVYP